MTPATDEELGEVRRLLDEEMLSRPAAIYFLRELLSRLESERERREAAERVVTAYRRAKEWLGADSYDGVDERGRELLEIASTLDRAHFATHTGEGDE